MLWLCAVSYGVVTGLAPGGMPKQAGLAWSVALPLVLAAWVSDDARKRGRQLCYDYDSFVYFAWPFIVPAYLFQTRGARAFITLLCFAGLWLIAALSACLILYFRKPAL
jgi:hypothetical protein